MLRSFKCIEISLSDQTPGAETLSKVCVWTNESLAGSVLCSHWSHWKLLRIQSIGKCVIYIHSRICPQPNSEPTHTPAPIACRQNQKMSQIKLLTLPFSHIIQILMIGTSGNTRYCLKTMR